MVYAVFLSTGQELRANRGRLALILEVEALTGDFHNSGIVLLLESKINFGDFQAVFAVLDHSDGGSVTDLRQKMRTLYNPGFILCAPILFKKGKCSPFLQLTPML